MRKKSSKEKRLKYTQAEYKDYMLKKFNFDVMSQYRGSAYPVKMKHMVCGGVSNRTTDQIRKNGCPYCNGSMLLKGFNDLSITKPNVYELLADKHDCMYFPHSSKKTLFKCPTCGEEFVKSINSVTKYGLNCPRCDDGFSYPEKFFMSVLRQGNIKFENQKRFDFIQNKKYDFYIPKKNCIVETHGAQHYSEIFKFKTKVRDERENDLLKRQAAIKNGVINYYEIDCKYSTVDYLKNSIIKSGILDLLEINITDIDFEKCAIDAHNSYAKQAWDLWNSGKYTNNEIALKLNLATNTTSHYLRTGAKLGICNYNGQMERNKASAHSIILTNTGEVFNFIKDAVRKYGVKNISGCCTGKIVSAGKMPDGTPMIWRYLEDYNKEKDYKYDNSVIKKIVCLETNEIFDKIIDAARKYEISACSISSNLTNNQSFGGRHPLTKMPLHWMYYDEFKMASKEYISQKIDATPLQYSSIICMNDLKIFKSASEALLHCNLKSVSSITDCCKGKIKYAGVVNGERGRWMYYKEYVKKYREMVKAI